jgi:hypothetical protein
MTAFLIHKGTVLAVGEAIDVLAEYPRRVGTKVNEVSVMHYSNERATLHVHYVNGAVGEFNGLRPDDLMYWANAQKHWPRAHPYHVNAPLVIDIDEEEATDIDNCDPIPEPQRVERNRPPPLRMARTRTGKKLSRSRV